MENYWLDLEIIEPDNKKRRCLCYLGSKTGKRTFYDSIQKRDSCFCVDTGVFSYIVIAYEK